MLPLRVTALGLTGLLLVATPSSLQLEPAQARAVESPGSAATTAEPSTEVHADATRSKPDDESVPTERQLVPATRLKRPANGEEAVRLLGDDLREVARTHEMSPARLRRTLRQDETLWVAPSGQLVVKEATHGGEQFADAELAAAEAPLDQTFALHSLPGSQHVIYLDFDGVDVTSSSAWATQFALPSGSYEGWDPMGDGPTFSADERAAIQEIWARVAEDYAPFDVDVTTADPGADALRADVAGDDQIGTRLVVTDSAQAPQTLCANGCGGVALLGAIDTPSAVAEPAWVFPALVSESPKAIAEVASHEVGHTFGLRHDGFDDGAGTSTTYYSGHGTWAPIMGSAYDAPVSQWSRGHYPGGTNFEDDVATIAAIAGHRTDEGGDDWSSPLRVTGGTAFSGSSDGDVYLVDECTTGARATVLTEGSAANLDVSLTLARPNGTSALAETTANPLLVRTDTSDTRPWYGGSYAAFGVTGLDASVAVPEGGPWLLRVSGGEGLISADGATDFSTYGSLGGYRVQVEGCSTPVVAPARPTGLALMLSGEDIVATWAAPADDGGSPITGYRLTLNGADPVDVAAGVTTHTFTGAAALNATVAVRALNATGAGPAATETSNPTTVPSQVTDVTVLTDDITCSFDGGTNIQRCIEVSWASPATDGGAPVTGYEFWQYDDRAGVWFKPFADFASTGGPERTTMKFNPIAGERTQYRIVALNANGAGTPYDFEALLKGPPARIEPTVSTDRDARTVTVQWETPFDGGEPIERTYLSLATGNYSDQVDVILEPDVTSYTFTGVKTGPKHVIIAASNIWGPDDTKPGYDNSSDTSFDMPPISPDPGPVDGNSIRATVLSTDTATNTGSLRITWDPVVPEDPDHDPILWYDVCVDIVGGAYLPGGAGFGDGAVRGTDVCGNGTTLALTADATDEPFIDLTGLTIGDHEVWINPVNPGGVAYMPAVRSVNFDPTTITCPTTPAQVSNGQLTFAWEWSTDNVNYWNVRARKAPETLWTDWGSGLAYYTRSVSGAVTPGAWEVEVTAHLRNGDVGAPVVCAVTVPEPDLTEPPVTDPEPEPPVTDPEPEPEPNTDPEPTTEPTTDPVTPAAPLPPAPTVGPVPEAPPVLQSPTAPSVKDVKAGRKGGAKTVTVKWSAPDSVGSNTITRYQVLVHKVKRRKLVVVDRITVPARKHVLELKHGKYKISVRAKNSVGWGSPSEVSKAVRPR